MSAPGEDLALVDDLPDVRVGGAGHQGYAPDAGHGSGVRVVTGQPLRDVRVQVGTVSRPARRGGHGYRRRVVGEVEGHARRRAAQQVLAQIGPVTAILDAQHVAQLQAGPGDRPADRVSNRVDERDDGGVRDGSGRGGPLQEVARRLGHSVAMLLKRYANCIEGQELAANERSRGHWRVTAYERLEADTGPLTRT